jgi:hypothetical protein
MTRKMRTMVREILEGLGCVLIIRYYILDQGTNLNCVAEEGYRHDGQMGLVDHE